MAAKQSTITRWLWIWITLGILVVVVVIGFLIGIVRALQSIDAGLFEASNSVTSIGQSANPLPGAIQNINISLDAIDKTLEPIEGQAVAIGTGLGSIRDSLVVIDPSLADTAGSLRDTNGSLMDTSAALMNVTETTGQINTSLSGTSGLLGGIGGTATAVELELEEAQNLNSQGTEAIPVNVMRANEPLRDIRDDTGNIIGLLQDVNQNLEAICESALLMLLPPRMFQECR